MDAHPQLMIFAIVAAGAVVMATMVLLRWRTAQAYRRAVRHVAREYRLRHTMMTGFLAGLRDTASGQIDGVSVEIQAEDDKAGDSSWPTQYLKLSAFGGFDWGIVIARRGSRGRSSTIVIDPNAPSGGETPTGDPELDARVEVHGANAALCEALRTREPRRLIERLVAEGGYVEQHSVVIRTRRLPKRSEDLVELLELAIEVCRHLTDLQPR